ncbi:FAD-dependent oxidoreductase [Saccharothrix sp. HUAS TT1]|uniref:FAD-dependent oxidoreductase n=1 Tax=unclassified Saccharothrix TaxID=2593673 RepID=UPI00345BE1BA
MLLGRGEPGATMAAKPRAYLQGALDRLGVVVRAGVEAVRVLPDGVAPAGGEHVAADVVLWTGGTRVPSPAAGLTVDERGRVVTDAVLRSASHPDVYAVGDAAAIRQGYGVLHGTCQAGCRPVCTPPCRSSARCGASAPGRSASATTTRRSARAGLTRWCSSRVPTTAPAAVGFDFDGDGRITALHNVANPDKLGAVGGGVAHDVRTR